jgi:heme-degrading monooxygenase HmoA
VNEFQVVWRFRPAPGREAEFVAAYGPDGDWARLFARVRGYRGTVLLRPAGAATDHLVIDRWDSEVDYDAARAALAREYDELDRACEALCAEEALVGRFTLA